MLLYALEWEEEENTVTYLVIARDGADPEAPARRQRVRDAHLEAIKPAALAGTLQLGGALLDDAGTMVGSALLVEADSRAALEDFLQNDVYTLEGVWQSFDIYPFKRAV